MSLMAAQAILPALNQQLKAYEVHCYSDDFCVYSSGVNSEIVFDTIDIY